MVFEVEIYAQVEYTKVKCTKIFKKCTKQMNTKVYQATSLPLALNFNQNETILNCKGFSLNYFLNAFLTRSAYLTVISVHLCSPGKSRLTV